MTPKILVSDDLRMYLTYVGTCSIVLIIICFGVILSLRVSCSVPHTYVRIYLLATLNPESSPVGDGREDQV